MTSATLKLPLWRIAVTLALGMWLSTSAAAAELKSLPRWEVGVGLGVLSLPFYRGAASGRTYIAPLPYIRYRGEHLRIDEEGIRSYLLLSDTARLDFSLAGGVPVSSDGNSARHDMPSLDPTVEIGPSLEFLLWHTKERDRALWLKFPLRAALSVALKNIEYQGWVFAPYLDYRVVKGDPAQPWTITLSLGPQFADQRYHDYFYEVTSAYVTPDRPEYHPTTGYSGSRLTLGLQKWLGSYWLGAFLRYDSLQGAVFSDSPLVQQQHYYAVGAAVVKLLAVSQQPAQSP
jgi:outer membrane scaffolding protein for murein synthesis (MipA/OmpV family)